MEGGVYRMSKKTENPLEIEEISGRKENMLTNQLAKALEKSAFVVVGSSRFDAKREQYDKLSEMGQKADSHSVNKEIGITSYASLHKFQSQLNVFGRFCFGSENLNNLNQIKPSHVEKFLNELCNHDYAKNTVQSYASALEKFAVVMDRAYPVTVPRSETWHEAVTSCRDAINVCAAKDTETRAYADPRAMIDALESPQMQLIASMQLDYGLRIADATKIDTRNIDGNILTVHNSKNGQDLRIELRPSDVARVKEIAGADGKIVVKQGDYREALKDACAATGQEWNGTHGLRHNYAQDRMSTLISQGKSYREALHIVSEEMGHHREDITETYLR